MNDVIDVINVIANIKTRRINCDVTLIAMMSRWCHSVTCLSHRGVLWIHPHTDICSAQRTLHRSYMTANIWRALRKKTHVSVALHSKTTLRKSQQVLLNLTWEKKWFIIIKCVFTSVCSCTVIPAVLTQWSVWCLCAHRSDSELLPNRPNSCRCWCPHICRH